MGFLLGGILASGIFAVGFWKWDFAGGIYLPNHFKASTSAIDLQLHLLEFIQNKCELYILHSYFQMQ